jgi:hypothetical protein
MTTSEGREVMAFHQIDFETGQVLSVSTQSLAKPTAHLRSFPLE